MSEIETMKVPADAGELLAQQEKARQLWRDIGALDEAERITAATEWAEQYGHLFYWCCGSPVLDPDHDVAYARTDAVGRGQGRPKTVHWYRA